MSQGDVALRIDVDTLRGTEQGVPAMLADLRAAEVRATFFVTLGHDRSGRALLRLLSSPSFLAKMVRTNAAKMYGLRTALYGTLLPAPNIGRRAADTLRRIEDDGHEVGLHAWDHRAWQDHLERRPRRWIDDQLDAGVAAFRAIFNRAPATFAAPAWMCTEDAWRALESRRLDYVSVTRARLPPFFPVLGDGQVLQTLEVPTTLPTLDEELGRAGTTAANYVDRLLAARTSIGVDVLTVHAETEGGAYRTQFSDWLRGERARGAAILRLADHAAAARPLAPERHVALGPIPGRAGRVAIADPAPSSTAPGI
jgi:undecaprenyl phosphate-alpha-L-ara4FN deformylase